MFLITPFSFIQIILVLLDLESAISEAVYFLTKRSSQNLDSVHWFGMKDV